jgi:hypothetical protein
MIPTSLLGQKQSVKYRGERQQRVDSVVPLSINQNPGHRLSTHVKLRAK